MSHPTGIGYKFASKGSDSWKMSGGHFSSNTSKSGKQNPRKLKMITIPNTIVHSHISPVRYSLKLDLEQTLSSIDSKSKKGSPNKLQWGVKTKREYMQWVDQHHEKLGLTNTSFLNNSIFNNKSVQNTSVLSFNSDPSLIHGSTMSQKSMLQLKQ